MRDDMLEVLLERSETQREHMKPKARNAWRRDMEHAVNQERMRPSRYKFFVAQLTPLRRYLRRQVGRSWYAVYSEICAQLTRQRLSGLNMRRILNHMAPSDVVLIDDQPHYGKASGRRYWALHGTEPIYVCPATGELKVAVAPPIEPPAPTVNEVRVDDSRQYRRIDGIWYEIILKPIRSGYEWDHLLNKATRELGFGLLYQHYGRGDLFAESKRQLNKRELKHLRRDAVLP